MRRINSVDDWQTIAEPRHWKPGRSAYELARKWQPSTIPPASVAKLLEGCDPVVEHLKFEVCVVEKPVVLDTLRGPSMTDLMAHARNAQGERVVIAVEGKTDETFGLRVFSWVRGDRELPKPVGEPRPSRLRRLEFLAAQLGRPIDMNSPLRYQLLHRTVSAVIEAAQCGATAAVVVVHSFAAVDSDQANWKDFEEFLGAFRLQAGKDRLVGPAGLGSPISLPVYFGWASDSSSSAIA
jgi:hypothetical protein